MKNGNKYLHPVIYSDTHHAEIQKKSRELISDSTTEKEKFKALFKFVRDGIPFGFPPIWDQVKASDTLRYGVGYCNSKSILLVALCRAADLEARIRFGLIDVEIMRGIFPNWVFKMIPRYASHSWVEIRLENDWYPVDAHIIDQHLLRAARISQIMAQTEIGFGIAYLLPNCTGNWNTGFVQTNAIIEDHGWWNDAGEFYNSEDYQKLKWWQLTTYPILRRLSNRNVSKIREKVPREAEEKMEKLSPV